MDQYINTDLHVFGESKFTGVFNFAVAFYNYHAKPENPVQVLAPLLNAFRYILWNCGNLYALFAEYLGIQLTVDLAGICLIAPEPFLNADMLIWFGRLFEDISIARIFAGMTKLCTVESAAILMSIGSYSMDILIIENVDYESPVYTYAVKLCIMKCFTSLGLRRFLSNTRLQNSVLEKIMAETPLAAITAHRSFIGEVTSDVSWRGEDMTRKILMWINGVGIQT